MIRDQRGMTVVEVLVAAVIIGIGLIGVFTVVPISSYGIFEGNHLTTATFLAEQRLEELKNGVWQQTPANDCVGLSAGNGDVAPTSTTCARTNPTVCNSGAACAIASDESPVTGYSGYGRQVRIVDCGSVAGGCGGVTDSNMRRISVTVTYTPLTGVGVAASVKSVVLTMNVSRR